MILHVMKNDPWSDHPETQFGPIYPFFQVNHGLHYVSRNSILIKCGCHNDFLLDLDDHKNKLSRHRSFLYGCDRSPEMYVLKLRIEIPNLKQNDWSTKLI